VADDGVAARLGIGEGQTGRLVIGGDISTVAQHRGMPIWSATLVAKVTTRCHTELSDL
jgi:hypothetical protein